MKKLIVMLFVAVVAVTIPTSTYSQGTSSQAVADEIIGMVKAQWAAQNAEPANLAESGKNTSDDYTEFNGTAATRVDGKSMNMRLEEVGLKASSRRMISEMLNPKVQVYGDAAILTYNFIGYDKGKDGEMEPNRAKSTRVYIRQGGKWKLVHANFAPDPAPKS